MKVDGKAITKKSYKVKGDEKIEVEDPSKFFDLQILDEAAWVDLPLIKETSDRVVVYKPAGVLSHPWSSWSLDVPSVVAWAWHRYKDQFASQEQDFLDNFLRIWLVHRLDKDTSGLMIVAKTQKAMQHFQSLFKHKSLYHQTDQLQKYYKALVKATLQGKNFINKIKTYPYLIKEIVKPKNVPLKEFKEWITIVESVQSLKGDFYLLNLQLITGRTHQIRYHLSNQGLKIVGDPLYGVENWNFNLKPYFSKFFNGEMALEAYRLIFENLNWKLEQIEV